MLSEGLKTLFFYKYVYRKVKNQMSYEKLDVTKGLMEAYVGMNASQDQEESVEQIDEAQVVPAAARLNQQTTKPRSKESAADARTRGDAVEYMRRGGAVGQLTRTLTRGFGSNKDIARVDAEDKASKARVNQRVAAAQGKYYSSSDNKTYKNYNDAVAARNSRLGANKPAPTGSSSRPASSTPAGSSVKPGSSAKPAAPSATAKVAPTKPAQTGDKSKDMQTWAKANPTLAAKVKQGQSGYSDIQKARAASGGSAAAPAAAKMNTANVTKTAFSSSTPALAKPLSSAAATASTTKSVDTTTPAQAKVAAAPKPITMGSKKPGSAFEEVEVDVFDLVLEYLMSEGHAETIAEAKYIMANLDSEMVQNIVEAKYGTKEGRHKLAMKRVKGEKIGKSGPGTGFEAVEKQAKKYGARDPKAVAAAAMYKMYGGKKEE